MMVGQGGSVSERLPTPVLFRRRRTRPAIGEVITNLNAVLATVDAKERVQFSASVDQLQQLVSGLAKNRDPIAGAIAAGVDDDGSYGTVAEFAPAAAS